jgi:psiF repeat
MTFRPPITDPQGDFMSIRNVLLTGILLATAFTASATTAQQEKMKGCNAQAKEQKLAGADRKGFMKTCLSSAPAAAAAKTLTPQQEKMKSCNADAKAKALKGDDRKAFMKTCLSGG